MSAGTIDPVAWHPRSRIAAVAPRPGVERALHRRLDLVLRVRRAQGSVVEDGASLHNEQARASGAAAERAAEPVRTRRRDDIDGIVLPYLENAEPSPTARVRAFRTLRPAGWFGGDIGHEPPPLTRVDGARARVRCGAGRGGPVHPRFV